MRFTLPAPVLRGDLIAVAAPSSGFDPAEFERGYQWLAERYRIRSSPTIFARRGYLAGDDARRRDELGAALADPEVKAIIMARGGYGAMRIVDGLPWDAFAAHPKWLVGFSDITTFHVEAMKRGIASLHAPHVTALGRMDGDALGAYEAALAHPGKELRFASLQARVPGDASGVLVGGNLALLQALAASGRLALPSGCILALEDVTEAPYRIDRLLTSLRLGGHLARAAGIVLGEFVDCPTGPDGVTPMDAIENCVRDLGVPVYAGAPFGHGAINTPFVLGVRAVLRAGELVTQLVE
ncbi:LD-carboxypeptidase [Pendulispora albinea]|uniref:LD-carboxypeptidase n=1 Tax=Pendulispora albinea TaxID=2741071 RepID=A0ABZ2M9B7_9BACT